MFRRNRMFPVQASRSGLNDLEGMRMFNPKQFGMMARTLAMLAPALMDYPPVRAQGSPLARRPKHEQPPHVAEYYKRRAQERRERRERRRNG